MTDRMIDRNYHNPYDQPDVDLPVCPVCKFEACNYDDGIYPCDSCAKLCEVCGEKDVEKDKLGECVKCLGGRV